jgi:hypothetical protein
MGAIAPATPTAVAAATARALMKLGRFLDIAVLISFGFGV